MVLSHTSQVHFRKVMVHLSGDAGNHRIPTTDLNNSRTAFSQGWGFKTGFRFFQDGSLVEIGLRLAGLGLSGHSMVKVVCGGFRSIGPRLDVDQLMVFWKPT